MTEAGTRRASIAIIGVSHWHLPLYLPGFAEADVVGVWDRVPARADHPSRSIVAMPYKSRAALLDQDIELVFGFGDPWEMLNHSMECLRRRIPISVEKPAAPSMPQLEELLSDAERAGVKAFVPLVLRTSKVPEVIDHLGVVGDLHAQYLTGPASRCTTGGYGWAVKDSVLAQDAWETPGRTSWTCSHLPSEEPITPFSLSSTRPHAGAADDRALVVLGSTEGSAASITLGFTTPHAQLSVGPRVVLTGSLATLVLSDTDAIFLHRDGTTSKPCPPLQWPSLFLAYVRAVLAHYGDGGDLPTLADLRNAYRVLSGPAETGQAL